MSKKNQDAPVLVGHEGYLDGQRWMLKDTIILGRDADCDITVPNRQVSRHHAELTPTHEGVILTDLGSKNGTHCNGKGITTSILLSDGDVIQIALAQKFVFLSSDATLPLEFNQFAETVQDQKKRLYLETRSRRVWIDKTEILPPLSASQFQLLKMLYESGERVVPRDELMTGIWGQEGAIDVSSQALDALVRRLRNRLAEIDPSHEYIVTVRGHGLRFDNPPAR